MTTGTGMRRPPLRTIRSGHSERDLWGASDQDPRGARQFSWATGGVADDGYPILPQAEQQDFKLHPQPAADPHDPLNWPKWKKSSIMGIAMYLYFMFAWITTVTVPSFPELQELYHVDYTLATWTVALPSIGLSLGPLFWSSFSDIYGRRIVFVTGTTIALLATIGAATSKTYSAYMVARLLQGFGASPGGIVGMAIVGDLFFEHERGQKLGLWVLALNGGLLAGPIIGGFVSLVGKTWIDWLTAILFGVLLLVELAFLPETLYPRIQMLAYMRMTIGIPATKTSQTTRSRQPSYIHHGSISQQARDRKEIPMKRTEQLSFLNVSPVPGMRHPKPWDSLIRFGLTFRYPDVVTIVGIYCFAWYWWILSFITLIPDAYSQYDPQIQGLLFIGLLLGTIFAELFCSGRLGDWLVQRLSDLNGGVRLAEMRLWLAYPAALLSATGLILWGISVDKHFHWIVGQIAFFLFAMGIQMGNTVVSTYIVDCYPLQSISVITFYSVLLDLGAFINPFYINPWINTNGYTVTFTVQGIITIFVAAPTIAFIHRFGPSLRKNFGEPDWVNAEYELFDDPVSDNIEVDSETLKRIRRESCT